MKNKRRIVLNSVIALSVVTVILAVALNASAYDHDKTYNANSTFFVEEHSTGAYCQNNTYVQVRVNTSVATPGLEMNITFDPNCVDITAADWTGSAWLGMPPTMSPVYEHNQDNIFLKSNNLSGPSGDNLLATITLHCLNATDDCSSYLNFNNVVISDIGGNPIYATWHNGTVACTGPPYLVTYTISKRTITPPETTRIDVEFSEYVSYKIAIEKNSATIYDWTGTAKNPAPKPWDGTYEATGTVVPPGDYTVNVTGTSTTTGLSVINKTEIITVATEALPDLNVTSIDINPAATSPVVDVIFINQTNNITAVVNNDNGTAAAGAFDVCFKDDTNGVNIGTVSVPGLAVGANITVYVNDWTPTCTDYPTVMPGHPCTSMAATINVTVDCNGAVAESDEGNNTLLKPLPAIQEWTKTGTYAGTYDVTAGVVNNGYKSKNFDCNTTEEPLFQFEYDSAITGGGIDYNVSGEKIYQFDGGDTDTRTHTITIPGSATVKKARLYVYWYDYFYSFNTSNAPESGALADISVNFTNSSSGYHNFTTPTALYSDQKGYGKYNSPKGTYAYDVTSLVTGSGDYDVTITNIDPNGNMTSLLGEMLFVVYENPDAHKTMQLWILEGNDYQSGRERYGSSTVEATATVAFPGNVDLANVANATLISVVAQGQTLGMNMLFNGGIIKTNAWDSPTEAYPNSKIDVESVNVKSNLASSGNNMGFQDNGTAGMQASNAMLILELEEPDLNVSSITINPGNTRGEDIVRVYVNEKNNISAVVWNNGTVDAGAFDVCFDVDGVKIGCETVAGLTAGANTTVSIEWTPTCANYPVMPGFPYTSKAIRINVSADCNCIFGCCPNCPPSCGKITESDETDNTLSKFIPAIQVYSGYNVIGGVVNNGYKSKNFDCDLTEKPLTLFEYDGAVIGGGIEYNVSGEKISTFAPGDTSTRIHHIDIPDTATVKKARLYVYWYDKWGNYKTYPSGCLANLRVTMGGTVFMPEEKYSDAKGFGYYQSPKGTYAYDVTSEVAGSGDYTAIVENIDPANSTTLLGQLLFVQYEDITKTNIVQKWILEGNDYLMAADDTHNKYDYCVSPEEATATVAFPGGIDLARVTNATLISVVAQGMENGSNMLFNGDVIKANAWNLPTDSKINVESIDVKTNLLSRGNNMGFLDNGTDGMQASNAFLIVEYKEAAVPAQVPVLNPIGLIALIGILSVVLAVATATLRRREKR